MSVDMLIGLLIGIGFGACFGILLIYALHEPKGIQKPQYQPAYGDDYKDYKDCIRNGGILGREYDGVIYFDPSLYINDPYFRHQLRELHKGKTFDVIHGTII